MRSHTRRKFYAELSQVKGKSGATADALLIWQP
jgi:hypothetical protein